MGSNPATLTISCTNDTRMSAPSQPRRRGVRYASGVAVVVLFQCAPLAIPWVWTTDWSAWIQTTLSAALALGIPEIGILLGIALIGKSEVRRIWRVIKVMWWKVTRFL